MQLKGERIGAYARYSSDRQNEASVEDQLRRLRAFASARGKQIDENLIFSDHAISGASTARPAFEALMEKVRRREIDVLLVEDTSRLSRDNADALNLYKLLAFYGVQLVAISDGIDSSTKGAKLAYSVKALMSDLYLEDLRDKTLRGMEGRALAGKASGGRATGYTTRAVMGPDGRTPLHFEIEIDPERAEVVRRIFAEYLKGHSLHGIATALNKAGIPSPRDTTRHERKTGWTGATIRAILYNERYTGLLVFNEHRWIKVPGTNRRVPQKKDPSEVIRVRREDLRIIDQDTWEATQERLRNIKSKYARDPDQRTIGRAHGASSLYPLSGLLFCDACSSPMTIGGGAKDRRYYTCVSSRNGRCGVDTSVRVEVVQRCVLGALRDRLLSGVDDLRKLLARRMGEIARNHASEAKEGRDRLQKAESRVANLVNVLASGERSTAVSEALKEAEATVASERRSLAELERLAAHPVRLLSPAEVRERLQQIEALVVSSPIEAREHLRRIFASGKIRLRLNADGVFVAHAEILGEILLVETRTPAAGFSPGREFTYDSSGGRI